MSNERIERTSPSLVTMIPSLGGGDKLRSTLDSLVACELPGTYSETWVIENGGIADVQAITQRMAELHPEFNFRYLYVERANKSHALNECISQLSAPCLIFMTDDDVQFDPQLLAQYSTASRGITSGVFFGGRVDIDSVGEADPDLVALMPNSMLGNNLSSRRPSSFFLGANWAAFSEDIKQAGGFDCRFGPGSKPAATGNESTMMRSLQQLGCTMQSVPQAVVWHSVDYTKITDKILNDRRHRSGVERGIRWAQEHRAARSVFRKLRLRSKLWLSHWLVSLYQRKSQRSTTRIDRLRFACRSCYHQGIIVGWNS